MAGIQEKIIGVIRLFFKKALTERQKYNIIKTAPTDIKAIGAGTLEKYSSGPRGAPAKGVGRLKPVREFKSLLLRQN